MTLARPLPLLLLALVAFSIFTGVWLGLHANLKHGADEAQAVRDLFNLDCKEKNGDILRFTSEKRGQDMNLCIINDGTKAGVWILCKNFPGLCGMTGEITAFFTRDNDLVRYITQTIQADAYKLIEGNPPEWIKRALEAVK
jgi:hypothetical protein